jgi:hypothetical protein
LLLLLFLSYKSSHNEKLHFLKCIISTKHGSLRAAKKQGKEHFDGDAGVIYFPTGDISFANEVVSFEKGDPYSTNTQGRITYNLYGGLPGVKK